MKRQALPLLLIGSLAVVGARVASAAPRSDSNSSAASGSASLMKSMTKVDESASVKTLNGIEYLDGGVGVDERKAFERMKPMFNTRLEFTMGKDHEYVAAVGVQVLDGHGNVVFNLSDAGPWLWLDLPAGRYTVDATWDGRTEHHVIQVGTLLHARSLFNWHAANMIAPEPMRGMG